MRASPFTAFSRDYDQFSYPHSRHHFAMFRNPSRPPYLPGSKGGEIILTSNPKSTIGASKPTPEKPSWCLFVDLLTKAKAEVPSSSLHICSLSVLGRNVESGPRALLVDWNSSSAVVSAKVDNTSSCLAHRQMQVEKLCPSTTSKYFILIWRDTLKASLQLVKIQLEIFSFLARFSHISCPLNRVINKQTLRMYVPTLAPAKRIKLWKGRMLYSVHCTLNTGCFSVYGAHCAEGITASKRIRNYLLAWEENSLHLEWNSRERKCGVKCAGELCGINSSHSWLPYRDSRQTCFPKEKERMPCILLFIALHCTALHCTALHCTALVPSRKSDQEISKSDFHQTIILPKIRPIADPNLLFMRSKSDYFQNLNYNIKHRKFHLRKIHI